MLRTARIDITGLLHRGGERGQVLILDSQKVSLAAGDIRLSVQFCDQWFGQGDGRKGITRRSVLARCQELG